MRIIALLVLMFGVALAGGAVFFASEYFRAYEASLASQVKPVPTTYIVVAQKPLAYGQRLTPEHLKFVEWPSSTVPEGAFTSPEAVFGPNEDQSRVVLRPMDVGEPVLASKVSALDEIPRVTMKLKDGMRAVSLQVNAVSGVAGFVAPGDRVDVIMTRNNANSLQSTVILQDVGVIAIDQQSSPDSSAPKIGRTVTVEVTPEDAQRLALAQQVGKLSLMLRGLYEQGHEQEVRPVGLGDLIDLQAPAEVEAPGTIVRVRKGTELEEVRVE